MVEGFLDKCTAAFPGIEKDNHTFPADKLMPGSSDDFSELSKKRQELATELGFPPSGSLIIDAAKTGRECTVQFKDADRRKFISDTIANAEKYVAEALLKGDKEFRLFDVGTGPLNKAGDKYLPPKLDADAKAIFDGINKNPVVRAEIKPDANVYEYYMVLSMRAKQK